MQPAYRMEHKHQNLYPSYQSKGDVNAERPSAMYVYKEVKFFGKCRFRFS